MSALRLSHANLASSFRFNIDKFDEYLTGSSSLTLKEEHEIRAQLEYKGAYFPLAPTAADEVNIAHPNMKFFLPKDSDEQAKVFADDARSFLFSADALCLRHGSAWEYAQLDLPIILLLTHAIELAVKSFLLKQKIEPSRNHKLLDLYDLCRKAGCERYIDLSDEEYWALGRLEKISKKAHHKYREINGEIVCEFRHQAFPIAEKSLRLAQPHIRPLVGPTGGNIQLIVAVPAGAPTPPKRSIAT